MFGERISRPVPELNGELVARFHYGISLLDDINVIPQPFGPDDTDDETLYPGFLISFLESGGGQSYMLAGVEAYPPLYERSLRLLRFNDIGNVGDYTQHELTLDEDKNRVRGRAPAPQDFVMYFNMPTFRVYAMRTLVGFTVYMRYKYSEIGSAYTQELARVIFANNCIKSGIYSGESGSVRLYHCFGLEEPD